jgi:hypothetical protein
LGVVVCAILLALPAWGRETDDANRLYESHKDAIYQVRIIEKSSGNKASIGSGFQISASGLVASNYHVVAEAVKKPEGYLIEYLASDGSKGNMRLLAVDVLHDLALLQHERTDAPWLDIHRGDIRKGTRIFSLGNPHDLGMTVVEGTYNGLVEHSLYEHVLISGSLNPGMSGGPSIDRDGRVVGVNVSTAGNQISFLVPVGYLETLLQSRAQDDAPPDWNKILEQQLLAHQDQYISRLLDTEWKLEPLGEVTVPAEIAPYVKCWGDKSDDKETLYQITNRICNVDESLFLGGYFTTGSFRFQYQWFETEKLNAVQFYSQLESRFYLDMNNNAYKDDVTPYACESRFVEVGGQPWKVHWCVRQYKRFPALHDVAVAMASLADNRKGMLVNFSVAGISRDHALQLTRRFIGAVQWKS